MIELESLTVLLKESLTKLFVVELESLMVEIELLFTESLMVSVNRLWLPNTVELKSLTELLTELLMVWIESWFGSNHLWFGSLTV